MSNQWLRLWHDMPNDPKWRTIARASKQPISVVISVYLHILVNASNATERGRTQNLQSEDIASALDIEIDEIDAVIEAMQGRVLENEHVMGWEKRQPKREDSSAERAKEWRERKRTQANAEERPDKDKDKDKDKEKIKDMSAKKFTDEDMTTAEEIWQGVRSLNPKQKPPNLNNWANEIRLMRERDKRTHQEINRLFAWANADNFWKTNILSPGTLRKQWDRLEIQRTNQPRAGPSRRPTFDELNQRGKTSGRTFESERLDD